MDTSHTKPGPNVHGDTVEVEIWSRSPQTCLVSLSRVVRGQSTVSSFLSATFTHANVIHCYET